MYDHAGLIMTVLIHVYVCPSRERQDSVFNGLQSVHSGAELICIHDAARPLVTTDCVRQVRALQNDVP